MKRVRIGNRCGFWGDNLDAPVRLAESGRLDYLSFAKTSSDSLASIRDP
jgi:hypothetical protein